MGRNGSSTPVGAPESSSKTVRAAERDVRGGVPALVGEHQATVADLRGDVEQHAGELPVARAVHHHASERVDGAAVEPGRDEDQLWRVGAQRGHDDALEHGVVRPRPRARRQRHVDVVALPVPLARRRRPRPVSAG